MKLRMVSGCIADSITADGKEEAGMTHHERHAATLSIMTWLLEHPEDNECFLNFLMQDFIREFGELSVSETPCSRCGDTICTWNIEI